MEYIVAIYLQKKHAGRFRKVEESQHGIMHRIISPEEKHEGRPGWKIAWQ
jgi:hypothetical protein